MVFIFTMSLSVSSSFVWCRLPSELLLVDLIWAQPLKRAASSCSQVCQQNFYHSRTALTFIISRTFIIGLLSPSQRCFLSSCCRKRSGSLPLVSPGPAVQLPLTLLRFLSQYLLRLILNLLRLMLNLLRLIINICSDWCSICSTIFGPWATVWPQHLIRIWIQFCTTSRNGVVRVRHTAHCDAC